LKRIPSQPHQQVNNNNNNNNNSDERPISEREMQLVESLSRSTFSPKGTSGRDKDRHERERDSAHSPNTNAASNHSNNSPSLSPSPARAEHDIIFSEERKKQRSGHLRSQKSFLLSSSGKVTVAGLGAESSLAPSTGSDAQNQMRRRSFTDPNVNVYAFVAIQCILIRCTLFFFSPLLYSAHWILEFSQIYLLFRGSHF
jgi:hypothetical protein